MGICRRRAPIDAGWRHLGWRLALLVALLLGVGPEGFLGAQAQGRLPSAELQRQQAEAEEHFRRKQWPEAIAARERVLATTRQEFGTDHEKVAIEALSLGLVAEAAGRLDLAERALRENVRIGELVYGKETVGATQGIEKLADILITAGRPAEAVGLLQRVITLRTNAFGPDHVQTASTHGLLGRASLARGDTMAALASFRHATRLLTAKREAQPLAREVQDLLVRYNQAIFTGHVEAALAVSQREPSQRAVVLDEAFAASQRAWTTAAGSALARMSARLANADTPLGQRIRRQQSASERVLVLYNDGQREDARWFALQRQDPAYMSALQAMQEISIANFRDSGPRVKRQTELARELQDLMARCPSSEEKGACKGATKQRTAIIDELGKLNARAPDRTKQLAEVAKRLEAAEARLPGYQAYKSARDKLWIEVSRLTSLVQQEIKAISKAFPDYVALTDPEPLSVAGVQGLLDPDDVLVTLLVGQKKSYVWAISREDAAWAPIDIGSEALAREVGLLRQGLDPLAQAGDGRTMPAFDLARAHALYMQVLGPVERVIASKAHLIVVPTGPLTSLPFNVLLTQPPPNTGEAGARLKAAPWLVRRQALSVLPSVPSLAALRRAKLPLAAAEPFLGIGDPALQGRPVPAGQARGVPQLASLYRNGKPDLRALRELQPLPETAAELKAIAEALSAPIGGLLLGHEATETKVRQTDLTRYRIVHFATHGLVAGELSGLAEPALVLTPPIRSTETDDGLLTASEVATLRLNADWVVLSACNTASGSQDGAEALSGLARAFFFAGSRALLVSHWAVNSDATVWLTTGTFAQLGKTPELGRSEAFRRTMLAMIDAGLPPSAWAPFVIVGEGGRGR